MLSAPPEFFLFWVRFWVKAADPPQNLRWIESNIKLLIACIIGPKNMPAIPRPKLYRLPQPIA